MISTFIPMSFQMTMIPKILRLLLIFPVLIGGALGVAILPGSIC